MRHRIRKFRIGRRPDHVRSLLSGQVCSLILEGRIKTTVAKAKETRRLAERMVTLAKKGTLHHRRRAVALLRPNTQTGGKFTGAKQRAVRHLFDELGPRYRERPGGYTRIIRLGRRQNDAAPMCYLEWVEKEFTPKAKGKEAVAEAETIETPALADEDAASAEETADTGAASEDAPAEAAAEDAATDDESSETEAPADDESPAESAQDDSSSEDAPAEEAPTDDGSKKDA